MYLLLYICMYNLKNVQIKIGNRKLFGRKVFIYV